MEGMHVVSSILLPSDDLPVWPVLTPVEVDEMIARHRRINEASERLTRLIGHVANDDLGADPAPVLDAA
jgi:hypothetical protein